MKPEDYVTVSREIHSVIENTKKLCPEFMEFFRCSRELFSKIYRDRAIGQDNKQILLYMDDIICLDINCPGFRKDYFVIQLHDYHVDKLTNLLDYKQFGRFVVISKEKANQLLKKATLDEFRKVKHEY